MSAGLDRSGPAASDYVGRVEANAMLRAWRGARKGMSRTPALDLRWTRVCFCGQQVEGGKVADESQVGIPFLTGSEEERGPLFDVTKEHFESRRAPAGVDPHGRKIFPPGAGGGVPNGVPLIAVRVGGRMIVSLPGEGTKEVGARIKAAAGGGGGRLGHREGGALGPGQRVRPLLHDARRSTRSSTTRAATPTSAACPRC